MAHGLIFDKYPSMKIALVLLFVLSIAYVHLRGRVRHKLTRQLGDHSSFLAPINSFLYLFSKHPAKPYLPVEAFPELKPLQEHWQEIREEGRQLLQVGEIKKSDNYDDVGFNSFFKTGWKRFYLKWYGESHPSAMALCPRTTELLQGIGTVKAAMFATLPPGPSWCATVTRMPAPTAITWAWTHRTTTPATSR